MSYAAGTQIVPNQPIYSGDSIEQFTVDPPLPAGLTIDPASGIISGSPQTPSRTVIYKVTGRNAGGTATAGLRIEVSPRTVAPGNLRYAVESPIYRQGQPIAPNTLSAQGGDFTLVTVSPSLPIGLMLDPRTGTITGTPMLSSPQAYYRVTVSNGAGSNTVLSLSISVEGTTPLPGPLQYHKQNAAYLLGQPIIPNLPLGGGGPITRFKVEPTLPSGLSLDTVSGAISGTPQASQPATDYVITGSNTAGSVSATVSIAVQAQGLMSFARSNFGLVLLSDGKALATGGYFSSIFYESPTNSAEVFDSGSNQWTATGSMNARRGFHTLTLLPDGKVLAVGGLDSEPIASRFLSSAELFDPTTGQWTPTGSMSVARGNHTATLLPNGRVLVVGGVSGAAGRVAELYDPATGQWTPAGSLSNAHQGGVLLPNGKVLAYGGESAVSELYDPLTDTWSLSGSMSVRDLPAFAVLLPTGKVLSAGGLSYDTLAFLSTANLYDPLAGQWTSTDPMSTARLGNTATLLPSGNVLVVGGITGDYSYLSTVEIYDSVTGHWLSANPLAEARSAHRAVALPDGRILLVGGGHGSGSINSSVFYIPGP
ncbi:kelch repeat-containing protein [Variovorax sp. YR216]|uniref:kelch repeat-containing protein n=1 Tax=Variovorax sp. YR216 TaxID=1882828 RepID=UPI00159FB4E6|nr:kelch repeat-containing protein [Variovorax sp. YR216]